jgi:hypothetical protein
VPCSASQVVPGAHRVVGPGTHRGSGPREVHTTETDLWAKFGRKVPFDKRFSSKHSVKTPAVGSASAFGRRAVSCLEEEAFGYA